MSQTQWVGDIFLATLYEAKHDYSSAIACFSEIMAYNSQAARVYFDRGVLYAQIGRKNLATTDFRRCLEISVYADFSNDVEDEIRKLQDSA